MPAATARKRDTNKQQAAAGRQAKAIKAAAVKKVEDTPHKEWLDEKPEACTEAEWADGCRVRELREVGLPWWGIAREMGLAGSGDSAATGKTGAGGARRIYKKAFGSLPETSRSRASTEGGGRKRQKREVTRGNAAEKLLAMDDQEVVEHLAGKYIYWTTSTLSASSGMDYTPADMDCRVGRRPVVATGKHGRFLTFNEPDAGSRSIYLHSIHTIADAPIRKG